MAQKLRHVSELCLSVSSSLDVFFPGQRLPYESSGHGLLDKQKIHKVFWEPEAVSKRKEIETVTGCQVRCTLGEKLSSPRK